MQHTKYFLFICFFSCLLGEVWGQNFTTNLPSARTVCNGSDFLLYVETNNNAANSFDWQRKRTTDTDFVSMPIDGSVSPISANTFILSNLQSADDDQTEYRVQISFGTGTPVTSAVMTLSFLAQTAGILPAIDNAPLSICDGDDLSLGMTLLSNTGTDGSVTWYSGPNRHSLSALTTQAYNGAPPAPHVASGFSDDVVFLQFEKTSPVCPSKFDSSLVTVSQPPTPNPQGPYGPYCTDAGLQTLNGVVPAGGSISWSGSGVSGSGTSYTFDPSGLSGSSPISLTFTAANSSGCSDDAMVMVTVNGLPAEPNVSSMSVCENEAPITLSNAYTWTVNGSSSTTFDPATANMGANTLIATATNSANCSRSKTVTYTVKASPADPIASSPVFCSNFPDITVTISGGVQGQTVGLYGSAADTATIGNFSIDHTFNSNGESTFTYGSGLGNPIYFQAETGGCYSNIVAHTIIEATSPNPPTITGDTEICAGLTATLTASGSGAGAEYTWLDNNTVDTLGNGSMYTTIALSNSITFKVIARDPMTGCYSARQAIPVVVNALPTAVIDLPNPSYVCDGASFVVSSANSQDGTGNITSVIWDLGDGTMPISTTTLGQESRIYSGPGSYPISLTVEDDNGCSDLATEVALVRALPEEIPEDSLNLSVCVNADAVRLATPLIDSGYSYVWSGDCVNNNGTRFDPECEDPDITEPVDKNLQVIIEDNFGCIDSFDYVFSVVPRPIAGFTIGNTCLKSEITAVDMSLNSPDQWKWFIDDDLDTTILASQGGGNPTFLFDADGDAGTHVIKLKVNSDGCVDEIMDTIEVYSLPEVDFTGTEESVCPGDEIRFVSSSDATSGGTLTSFEWNLGDGNTSTAEVFDYSYSGASSHQTLSVVLRVGEEIDTLTCFNELTQNITIKPQPKLSLMLETPAICNTNTTEVEIKIESEGGDAIASNMWIPGYGTETVSFAKNGTETIDSTFMHSYFVPYPETVEPFVSTLTATGANGCSNTITDSVEILFTGPRITQEPLLLGTDLLVSRDDSPDIDYKWYVTCDEGVTSEPASGENEEQFYCVKDNDNCKYFVVTKNSSSSCETRSELVSRTGREGLPLSTFFRRGMKLYPSPNQGNFSLEILHEATGGAQLLITDIAGKQVYTETFEKTSSLFTHKVNAAGLAEGLYIAKVRMAHGVWFSQKMMVR